MLRHSDRKDFLCSTCGKQFKVGRVRDVQTQSVGLLVCSCVTTSCLSTPQRKDKLREHMQRMHNPDREAKKADRIHRSKSLKLRAPSSDFESFMFKCRLCMMGFRRRGMLVSQRSCSRLCLLLTSGLSPCCCVSWSQVNHLSKRHPEMRIDDVPELTLPIIKPNRDYFCQYCDKVRSAHPGDF